MDDNTLDSKLELSIKISLRTDSYLNSANTKSTILLSLSAAVIAAIAVNYEKVSDSISAQNDRFIYLIIILISVVFLLASIWFSLNAITPYLKKSEQPNQFSFIDIIHDNKNPKDYYDKILDYNKSAMLEQITYLNYNLAKALRLKYLSQVRSIIAFKFSIFFIILSIGWPIFIYFC